MDSTISKSSNVPILSFPIFPGKFVGPFQISMPLSEALKVIQKSYLEYVHQIEIIYDNLEPLSRDFIINFVDYSIQLKFCPLTQRLTVITIENLMKVQLLYASTAFTGDFNRSTFVKIYQLFGPTFPGKLEKDQNLYCLGYPGMIVRFPIPKKYCYLYENTQDLPIILPDNYTPNASEVVIFKGAASDDDNDDTSMSSSVGLRHPTSMSSTNAIQDATSWPSEYVTMINHGNVQQQKQEEEQGQQQQQKIGNGITSSGGTGFYFEEVQLDLGEGITFLQRPANLLQQPTTQEMQNQIKVQQGHKRILFGMTPQEVISELGYGPENVFYKKHDKLAVHSLGLKEIKPEEKGVIDYFHNYFSLGMDMMYDGHLHVLKKIIIHTNFPGSRDFNVYLRCNFKLPLTPALVGTDNNLNSSHQTTRRIVSVSDKFDTFRDHFDPGRQCQPLVNSNTPFGQSWYYSFKHIIFEVLESGYLNSICLYRF